MSVLRIQYWFCVVLLVFSVGICNAQQKWWSGVVSTSRVNAAKEQFDFDEWGGVTETNYAHTVTNWIVSQTPPGFTNLSSWTSVAATNDSEVVRENGYTVVDGSTLAQWRIHTWEFSAVSNAHEMMVARFAWSTVPLGRIDDGEDSGANVGDKCYGLSLPKSMFWFCRNNVFVEIAAPVTSFSSCLGVATNLDLDIMDASD
jgi:hypothetical protein